MHSPMNFRLEAEVVYRGPGAIFFLNHFRVGSTWSSVKMFGVLLPSSSSFAVVDFSLPSSSEYLLLLQPLSWKKIFKTIHISHLSISPYISCLNKKPLCYCQKTKSTIYHAKWKWSFFIKNVRNWFGCSSIYSRGKKTKWSFPSRHF